MTINLTLIDGAGEPLPLPDGATLVLLADGLPVARSTPSAGLASFDAEVKAAALLTVRLELPT